MTGSVTNAHSKPAPRPSLERARPMLLERAIDRAPSLHRGGRYQALRPRPERDDAPARGTRRGSSDGMAPWRHLTAGKALRSKLRNVPGCVVVAQRAPARGATRQNSHRAAMSVAGERGGGFLSLSRGRNGWRKPTPNADRGGSLARRRIHGSRACPRVEHALQRSVGSRKSHRSSLETSSLLIHVRCAGALVRPPVGGQQEGRRGLGRG